MLRRRTVITGLACTLAAPARPAEPRPQRIVSLNTCLDAALVDVADATQIAAISHYARDPQTSTIAERARSLPITFESAEEIIALKPDLVLGSRHSAPATRAALTRFGVRLETFTVPDTVAQSLAQVERIASLSGNEARGKALVERVEAALRAALPGDERRPAALVVQARGFAAGEGTLVDEMLKRTGFTNAANRYGLKKWGNVTLEALLDDPPDLLLAGERAAEMPSWAERILQHPVLRSVAGRMRRAIFPERLFYCGGPVLLQTASVLSNARRDWARAA